jgi:type IV pilus assembly protein PilA
MRLNRSTAQPGIVIIINHTMNKKLNSSKGFTLVEIMIVVVIIGLLAAMAIPAFQKVRVSSIEKTVINDGRLIGAAVQQYSMEYGTTGVTGLTYNSTTGIIDGNDNYEQYLRAISKGYTTATIAPITAAGDVTNAFTLTKAPAFPATTGAAVFDGEGKKRN